MQLQFAPSLRPCHSIGHFPDRNRDNCECTYCGMTITAVSRAQSRSMHSVIRGSHKNARAAQQALRKSSVSHAQMIQRMHLIRGITRYTSAPYQMQFIGSGYGGLNSFEQHHRITTVGPNHKSAMTEDESHFHGDGPWQTTT
eukprot:7627937-Karenia_brevis.AAC.1